MKSSEGNGKREEKEVQTGLVAAFCVGALLKRTASRMVSRGNASSHSIMKRGLSHRFADVGASYLINSSSRLNQENEQQLHGATSLFPYYFGDLHNILVFCLLLLVPLTNNFLWRNALNLLSQSHQEEERTFSAALT